MDEHAPTREHFEKLKREKNNMEVPPSSDHYKKLRIEPLAYIEANALSFHEGNIIKYVTRWQYKNGTEDLYKARWYIERLIELAEDEEGRNVD